MADKRHGSSSRKASSRGRSHRTRPSRNASQSVKGRVSKKVLLVPGLLIVVGLGGATSLWAQGLVLAIAGLWAIIMPPAYTPSRRLDWVLLALFLWSWTAFLPDGLLGTAQWRVNLAEAGLNLGWFASAQPWVSLEGILLLLGGILSFFLIWNCEPDYEERRLMLWVFAIGTALLAIGQTVAGLYQWRSPFQAPGLGFSYFPNKNQTGLFFAMGGSVCFGLTIHLLRFRRASALVAGISLLACFLGVIYSLSRAALILFFVGCIISYLTAFNLRRGFRLLRYVLPILIIGMSVLLVMGRESLARFAFWQGDDAGELRLNIYRDTLGMVTQLPATGLAMGNFAGVFPQFREHTQVAQSVIHPESDWLWLLAELGLPGFAFMCLAVVVAIGRLIPFGDERSVAYRATAAGAVFIFLIHSLFDVPAHRLGTLLCAFLLYRLLVAAKPKEPHCLLPRWAWRTAGMICLMAGSAWAAAGFFNLPWSPGLVAKAADKTLNQPFTAATQQRLEEALEDALSAKPLDWRYYTTRARFHLTYERDAQAAEQDFSIARLLEPNSAEVPFQEGVIWMPYSPRQAALAWREALDRNSMMPRTLYREIVTIGNQKPQFARELNNLSIVDPGLRHYYLTRKRGHSFDEAIYYEMGQDPMLRRFTPEQRHGLLEHWALLGDGSNLRDHLNQHRELTASSWYYSGLSWAAQKDFTKAIEAVQSHVTIPRFPEFTHFATATTNELRKAFMMNPQDIVRGSVLLKRQLDNEDWDGARETATLMTEADSIPDYAYFWKGELDRRAGMYKDAWVAWLPYMRQLVDVREK